MKTNLNTEIPSVYIVTEKQIPGLSRIATNFKEFHQIKVLAMHIATDSNRRIHLEQIRLGSQDFRSSANKPKGLLFTYATLAVEVLLEKGNVRLCAVVW